MSRWGAAAIHLGISALVVGAIALAIVWVWYPPSTWNLAAAGKLLLIIAAVDVVIGPLLTLIVFRSGKPSLRLDLTVIALLQLTALLYGLHVVWTSRPVFIVGYAGDFHLVFATDLDAQDLARADPRFGSLPWFGPQLVGARMPSDPAQRSELIIEALSGRGAQVHPQYYVDYTEVAGEIASSARPVPQGSGITVRPEIGWVPYFSSRGAAVMLVDRSTGEVHGPGGAAPSEWMDRPQ